MLSYPDPLMQILFHLNEKRLRPQSEYGVLSEIDLSLSKETGMPFLKSALEQVLSSRVSVLR